LVVTVKVRPLPSSTSSTRDPHRVHAVPTRAAQPADALLLRESHGFARGCIGVAGRVLDAHQDLVQHDVVENADRRFFPQPVGETPRQ